MIHIPMRLLNDIVLYCIEKSPEEACGALVGHQRGNVNYVTDLIPITNNSTEASHHFVMNPQEWIHQLYEIEKTKRTIAGIFHSHVNTPAVPSSEDLQTLWHSLPSYWIVSLMNVKEPSIKAYRLTKNSYTELEIFN